MNMETLSVVPHTPDPNPEFNHLDRAIEVSGRIKDVIVDQGLVAFRGIRAALSRKRMEQAAGRMETMDHKDALYADLGSLAVTGNRTVSETATSRPAMPRALTEQFVDKKLDKRAIKRQNAELYSYRARKIFGAKEDLVGLNKHERRQQKTEIQHQKDRGEITASEARVQSMEIDTAPPKFGEKFHKLTSKQERRANRRLNRALRQPVSKKWRSWRRSEAIKDVGRHQRNAEKHETRRDAIPDKRVRKTERRAERIEKWHNRRETARRHASRAARATGRGVWAGTKLTGRGIKFGGRMAKEYGIQKAEATKVAYQEGLTGINPNQGFIQKRINKMARNAGRRQTANKEKAEKQNIGWGGE